MCNKANGSGKVLTALFIDFDNIFTRLKQQDSDTAVQFASNPGRWLDWIENHMPSDHINGGGKARKVLVRRCYLNPKEYQTFRPYFIRSAFQVIDCPPLTKQGKNCADIRMVMDILDILDHDTDFDEFIIFSGDADFTPVLLRLRKHNRSSAVLVIGPASPAYKAASDLVIEQDVFVEDALGQIREQPLVQAEFSEEDSKLLAEIAVFIQEKVRASSTPVAFARLAEEITARFGINGADTDWLGFGKFKGLLMALDLGKLEISPISPCFVYDPKRHQQPQVCAVSGVVKAPDEFMERYPDLAPFAKRINQLTDTPYLLPDYYAVMLREAANEINENEFFLNQTSKAVRDRCIEQDIPIARSHANFVLRGIAFTGHSFGEQLESPLSLGAAFVSNIINLCDAAHLELDSYEIGQIHEWITGALD